jgi:hypothetical protein
MDANKIHEQVLEKMSKSGFPAPTKPSFEDAEIALPPDPSELTSIELAQKLSKSAAWFSYCQYRLGQVESELVLQQAEYKVKLNLASIPVREELGRQNADVIEAAVLGGSTEILTIYERIAELTSIKESLEARLSVYDKFYSALSREQSRRDTESRVI